MSRPPTVTFESELQSALFRSCEDIRRAFARDVDELSRCNTFREWIVMWLRTSARLSDCISWSMDDDTAIARKMRANLPDVIISCVVVLIGWRLWWQRQ